MMMIVMMIEDGAARSGRCHFGSARDDGHRANRCRQWDSICVVPRRVIARAVDARRARKRPRYFVLASRVETESMVNARRRRLRRRRLGIAAGIAGGRLQRRNVIR